MNTSGLIYTRRQVNAPTLSNWVSSWKMPNLILLRVSQLIVRQHSSTTNLIQYLTSSLLAWTVIYPSKTHPGIILHALSLSISSLAPLGHFSKTPHQQHHKYSHHFAKTYTSHDALLQDQTITAVYICAPISARYALAKKALTAGKHVLCEGPVAGSSEGVKEVHGLAGEKGAVLLDGVSPTLRIPLFL